MGLLDSLLSAYQSGMGLLNSEPPKKSVMGNYQEPKRYIGPYVNPEEPLSAPTIGPVSLDPTDYIGPNAIAKAGAVVKGLLGSAAAKGAMFAPIGMTAWHGSPHKFDRFDMSKIGTGEGAQAYGHGLYVAESPAVAKEYQKMLAGPELDATEVQRQIRYAKAMAAKTKDSKARAGYESAVKELESSGGTQGSLYKVDIPDEAVARFLDWDKPLSQQAPEVQKAIEGSPYALRDMAMMVTGNNDPLGGELIKTVMNPNEIAIHLRQQGIPGIRYLDGGSRGAGGGTSNFVLFDDTMPRILERNGVPTGQVPWEPGEWGGLLNSR